MQLRTAPRARMRRGRGWRLDFFRSCMLGIIEDRRSLGGVFSVRFGLRGRMRRVVDGEQPAQRRAGVDLRRVALGVTEDLLDQRQVRAVLVHLRGHRVAVDVARAGLVDPRRTQVATAVLGQRVRSDRLGCRRDASSSVGPAAPSLQRHQNASTGPVPVV